MTTEERERQTLSLRRLKRARQHLKSARDLNVFQVISQRKFASTLRMILPPGEVGHDPEEEHNHRYGDQ